MGWPIRGFSLSEIVSLDPGRIEIHTLISFFASSSRWILKMKVPTPKFPACWGVISRLTLQVTNLIFGMIVSLETQVEVVDMSPNA